MLINLTLVFALLIGIWTMVFGLRYLLRTLDKELSRGIVGLLAGLALSLAVGSLLVHFSLTGVFGGGLLSFGLLIGALCVSWRWIAAAKVILWFFCILLIFCGTMTAAELVGRFGLLKSPFQSLSGFAFASGRDCWSG